MHPSSMASCAQFINKYLTPRSKEKLLIADVGSLDVNGTYRPLFALQEKWEYIGLDIEAGPNVDYVIPERSLWRHASPVGSGDCIKTISVPLPLFDAIISGQCLEHVYKPWVWIVQLSELLKPGGLVFITAPNTWVFHEYPIDCWRVWPDGMRALFDEADIECLEAYITGEPDKPYDTVGIGRKR